MQDPCLAADGQTYERAAIEEWLTRSNSSPLTGRPLMHRNLVRNIALAGVIEEMKQAEREANGPWGGGRPS